MLAKVDNRSAHRISPVQPEDHWLLGMLWQRSLFVNTTLSFGLCSATGILNLMQLQMQWSGWQAKIKFGSCTATDFSGMAKLVVTKLDTTVCRLFELA